MIGVNISFAMFFLLTDTQADFIHIDFLLLCNVVAINLFLSTAFACRRHRASAMAMCICKKNCDSLHTLYVLYRRKNPGQ